MSFNIEIVGTGSSGNCIIIDDSIMIDVGLPNKVLQDRVLDVEYILITHRHGDHLNIPVLNKLHKTKPWALQKMLHVNEDTLNFILERSKLLGRELVLPEANIITDKKEFEIKTKNDTYTLETFELFHDVENYGFVITKESTGENLIFATDTNSMKEAPRRKYDYIIVEGNYDEDKLFEAMLADDFQTRHRAFRNTRHFSVQQFEKFVLEHRKPESVIYQLHASGTFGIDSEFGSNNEFEGRRMYQ